MKKLSKGGWIPDLPDHRDWLWKDLRRAAKALPKKVDLSGICSPVEDQGQLGSCTAQALVGALEFLERKDAVSFADLSRLFLYYNERLALGTVDSDSGAMLRDGIKCLAKKGICEEAAWPYRLARWKARPPASCFKSALDHQITAYRRLLTLAEMKTCLSEGYPFVFGFMVYQSLQSPAVSRSGDIPLPGPKEASLGGHAVLAVGFDEARKRVLIRNSWGRSWGRLGYGSIPYAYLENRNLSDDFWTIRGGEGF